MALSTSTMAPPLSPKEPRRSNRRSAHSSTSTSKSSGSPSPDTTALPPPPTKEKEPDTHSGRSGASSSSNSTHPRSKRAKEEQDDSHSFLNAGHRRTTSVSSSHVAPSTSTTGKRTKRKGKEPPLQPEEPGEVGIEDAQEAGEAPAPEGGNEEEETRCVCDGLGPPSDDDGDAADFMIQCEICKVWQHGPCMGFPNESDIPEGDYYCEECKPEDHVELLKRLKRQRQSSEKSQHTAHPSRASRSHSPSHFQQKSKRRNTMNSRDAAYEESVQQLLETSAAEAAALGGDTASNRAASVAEEIAEEVVETGPGGRKKRKRADEELVSSKRKRSTSIISDRIITSVQPDKTGEILPTAVTDLAALLPPPAPPAGGKSRVRRGGGRKATVPTDGAPSVEGEDGPAPTRKHPNQYTYRGKPGNSVQMRRPPPSISGASQTSANHDHGTRRNAIIAVNAVPGANSRSAHNAYYNNIQQPMFTSWNLPDYLAHLQTILPNEVPPPLQIRGATSFFRDDVGSNVITTGISVTGSSSETAEAAPASIPANEEPETEAQKTDASAANRIAAAMSNATESLTERGVKVKWPAKRMSVADMNKRVRALVEWVGREQAHASERDRRKAALEAALRVNQQAQAHRVSAGKARVEANNYADATRTGDTIDIKPTESRNPDATAAMIVDTVQAVDSPFEEKQPLSASPEQTVGRGALGFTSEDKFFFGGEATSRPSTTKMMEELMEELISFQERFGPGAKSQIRERSNRIVSLA